MNQKATNIDELLQLAREDIARNRLSSAEKTLAQAILLNNQVSDAFYLMGYVYSKTGKLKKAILAFERSLSMDPFHTEAAIALSSLYNDMGKYKEGASVFFKARRRLDRVLPGHDPKINQLLATKHHELGLLYLRFERFREAHDEFERVQQLDPGNVQAAVKMAVCLGRTGDKPAAVDLLKKLLEHHPKCIDAKIQLGILHHSLRNLQDAYREWQGALAIDPDHKGAQMYLSMIENRSPRPSAPTVEENA